MNVSSWHHHESAIPARPDAHPVTWSQSRGHTRLPPAVIRRTAELQASCLCYTSQCDAPGCIWFDFSEVRGATRVVLRQQEPLMGFLSLLFTVTTLRNAHGFKKENSGNLHVRKIILQALRVNQMASATHTHRHAGRGWQTPQSLRKKKQPQRASSFIQISWQRRLQHAAAGRHSTPWEKNDLILKTRSWWKTLFALSAEYYFLHWWIFTASSHQCGRRGNSELRTCGTSQHRST